MEDGNKEEKEKEEDICAGKPRLKLSGSQGKRKYGAFCLLKAIAIVWHLFHYPFKIFS